VEALTEKVRVELQRYEHPLFAFDARPAPGGVEILIRFQPEGVPEANGKIHEYVFLMHAKEIENAQFPWSFQRQLYDCLHDYVIEMFTRNPQCQDA
jgi:hypothetical protein